MYSKIIIGLLLSGYISTSIATPQPEIYHDYSTEVSAATKKVLPTTPQASQPRLTEVLVTRDRPITGGEKKAARKQLEHTFSEPVIIAIILVVMAGVIGTILLFSYIIGKLTKKSSPDAQPAFVPDADVPLSSVETENPEK